MHSHGAFNSHLNFQNPVQRDSTIRKWEINALTVILVSNLLVAKFLSFLKIIDLRNNCNSNDQISFKPDYLIN